LLVDVIDVKNEHVPIVQNVAFIVQKHFVRRVVVVRQQTKKCRNVVNVMVVVMLLMDNALLMLIILTLQFSSSSSSSMILNYLVLIVKNIVTFVNCTFVSHVPNESLIMHQFQTTMEHHLPQKNHQYKHNVECVL